MRKKLLSLLVLLMVAVTGAWAQPWTSGDCTVNLSDGVLTVSKTSGDGNGAMANTTQRQRPWYNSLQSITSVVVEEGVTHIGTSAFLNCTNLASATIPASVTSIGNQAFQTCTGMTSVTIADGSSLTSIGNSAFYGCISLGSITLPASVTSIGQRAFNMCNNLATATLNSNPYIGSGAFDDIKDGATVTMNLTATSADGAKWTTFYNNAYGFQADANTEVFKVALSGTALTLNKVDNGIVDAGTAVVLKTTGGNPVMTLTTSASSDTQDNSLTGVSAAAGATSDGTFYVLDNGTSGLGFYKVASGDIVPVGNAYLTSDSQNDFLSIGGSSGGSEESSTYTVSFAENTEDADNWTGKAGDATEYQKLPLEGVAEGTQVSLKYSGLKKVKSVKAVKKAPAVPSYDNTLNINTYDPELNNWEDVTVPTGKHWLITGTGEATTNVIIIANNATVTLSGVNITAFGRSIICLGNATIILADGTTNNLYAADEFGAAGIEMSGGSGTSLTIQGNTGVLNITSGSGPAIGAGYGYAGCAINIEGGIINATSTDGPGIGAAYNTACGNITISGGTVAATGGYGCPGIGGASSANCGDITITSNVTSVTATKGFEAPYSIGASSSGSCGTVTIGGVVGAITESPFTYPAPAGPTAYTLAESTQGMIVGTDGKAYDVADKDNLPSGVTAAGVVVYKNGANGLAIALTDEASMMDWATACGESGAAAHTPAVEGQTWKLPSQEEWTLVKNANSGSSLNSAITNAGGTAIPTVHFDHETQIMTGQYWLSTQGAIDESARTWGINGYDEIVTDSQSLKTDNLLVRACLAW